MAFLCQGQLHKSSFIVGSSGREEDHSVWDFEIPEVQN
jgi:hypothetical protein